ncbi:hypothetical protein Q8A73_024031 [Channa argus]|nr:hypothetical protein Q8A73_024031 [Channa argus]
MVPLEVALLLKVKPAAAETSAVVTLLDWCDLHNELILVLERPVPCMELLDFIITRGYILQEHLAKEITKHLVDALLEVHSKSVFHRDIKLDNILIETSSDVPRVRLIDFGCGTLLRDGGYTRKEGTYEYLTPEWFQWRWYKAEPTTVWQLGVVLFAMLHGHLPFKHERQIVCEDPAISEGLSVGCLNFLLRCLSKKSEARPSLETLKNHYWLMTHYSRTIPTTAPNIHNSVM